MNNKTFDQLQSEIEQLQSEIDMYLETSSDIITETIYKMAKNKEVRNEKMNALRKQLKEIESFKF